MNPRINAERPFLEQWEQEAMGDDRALSWLEEQIYRRPDRLFELSPIAGFQTSTKFSEPISPSPVSTPGDEVSFSETALE